MVSKRHYHEDLSTPPPPMDESWWEAVLAEDEAQNIARTARNSRNSGAANHGDPAVAQQNDLITLDWQKAFDLFEQDQVVSLVVSGANRGGLLVQGEKLQGFVPV